MHSFDDIIGQDTIISHLKSAISEGKPSHAYIFCGDEGCGKRLLADRFSAGLLCEGEGDRPCGACIPCMQTGSGNHPDIVYVTHEKKNITVGDIRTQVVSDVSIKPYSGRFKIYIIEDADKMNEEAQNALLKTLEEPPEYAVILLLAQNTGAFLQTILSRCVLLRFVPLSSEQIMKYLNTNYQIVDYLGKLCAAFSNGSIGKAVKYARSEEFSKAREQVLRLVKNIESMSLADISARLNELNPSKNTESTFSFDDYLNLLGIWYHDVLIFKATRDINKVVFQDEIRELGKQATNLSYDRVSGIIDAIDRTRQRLNANVYFDVAVELLLIKIKGKA